MPAPSDKDTPPPRAPENEVQAMLRYNGEREAQRAREQATAKAKPQQAPDNDVLAMLRQNQAHEAGRSINQEIPYVPKKSRRRRDFILSLVGGNLLIVGAMISMKGNVVVLVYGFSGIILLTAGLIWTMFFVMDDY